MIPDDFPETGLHFALTGAKITRYQVFGERSSGTNYVKRLIGRNTALAPSDDFGWKHGFPHMTAIPADLAVICVMRHAAEWALSMHSKPWHCPPAMQRLPFAAFLRAEWATIADRPRYFPQVQAHGGSGEALQLDRHPLTGAPFANLFALRRAKLEGLLGFLNRGCSVIFCRLETVQGDPQSFLKTLEKRLTLPPAPQPYRPVVKRLGSRFLPSVEERPSTPDLLSPDDLTFLQSQLDLGREADLGYRYS
ncbi:hypothetical protein [Salipiger bermudensis]|uniref:hypothetical protein n=1 Tax=Salipiger bermudensis TaxID=344736 RepID=UPI001CD7B945|nr:hypothetical protein [Salipiger bermudensis]MCA1285636.1 hypothetical protein [Salipiger bermudensis]